MDRLFDIINSLLINYHSLFISYGLFLTTKLSVFDLEAH